MHPVTPFKSGALIFSITREPQLNVQAAIHCPGKYQARNSAVDSFKTESLDSWNKHSTKKVTTLRQVSIFLKNLNFYKYFYNQFTKNV